MSYRKPRSLVSGLTLQLLNQWKGCQKCPICKLTTQKVLPTGDVLKSPIDVAFIGEAPGKDEDATGVPFIGLSGQLLARMIRRVQRSFNEDFTYIILNTVACTPFTDESRSDIRAPFGEEKENCKPWVEEFVNLKKPRLIVCIGKHAEVYLKTFKIPTIEILHPAYILRQGGESSIHFKRTVLKLTKEIHRALETSKKRRKRKTHNI